MQLAFLHIPKTGGRTMAEFCRYHYRPDQCQAIHEKDFDNPQIEDALFVHAHFPYETAPPHESRLTFTILREPAARIASYYQMALRSKPEDWPQYEQFWPDGKPLSILDFARDEILKSKQVKNAMVRQLVNHELMLSDRPVNANDLQIAKQHLSTLMVGFTEDYDSFLERLCERMGWDIPSRYPRWNESMPYQVDTNILEELRAMNQWDCRLYEWAKKNLNG